VRDAHIVVLQWPQFALKTSTASKSDQENPPLGSQPVSVGGSCSGLFPNCSLALSQPVQRAIQRLPLSLAPS
jgi:hypothetical protein